MRLAAIVLVACTRIVYRDIKPDNVPANVPAACVASEPPEAPCDAGICVEPMTDEDCRHLRNAMWSDYGHELARWVALAVMPRCAGR